MLFITSDQELNYCSKHFAGVFCDRVNPLNLCQCLCRSRPSPSAPSTHFCFSRRIFPSVHYSVPSIPDKQRRDEQASDRHQ